ncbi:MAG: hypothetical protein OXT67_03295 [Zetaproteobacteria bacterium]|nr:hypothetical protein [Zetaproteobacteria bacterium]
MQKHFFAVIFVAQSLWCNVTGWGASPHVDMRQEIMEVDAIMSIVAWIAGTSIAVATRDLGLYHPEPWNSHHPEQVFSKRLYLAVDQACGRQATLAVRNQVGEMFSKVSWASWLDLCLGSWGRSEQGFTCARREAMHLVLHSKDALYFYDATTRLAIQAIDAERSIPQIARMVATSAWMEMQPILRLIPAQVTRVPQRMLTEEYSLEQALQKLQQPVEDGSLSVVVDKIAEYYRARVAQLQQRFLSESSL